jgi:NADH-quinone oxidoreductase subunit N
MGMSEIDWSELSLMTPVAVILGAALVVVFLDLALSHKDRYILPWIALTGTILGIAATIQTATAPHFAAPWFLDHSQFSSGAAPKGLILGGAFVIDHFGMAIWFICCLAGGLSILCSPPPKEDSALSTGEYYGLTLLAVAGMMLLATSHDFMTLVVSLEIMSIATYILTGSSRENIMSNEAGIKYLVLGAFSTAFLLMGIAFYYGAFGSFSLAPNEAFQSLMGSNPTEAGYRGCLIYLALGFIFVGALFKVGASPFHFWIPDVYEGAPTAVTGLMAVGVKAAAITVVGRLAFETFGLYEYRLNYVPLLTFLAVLTMFVGNIFAMRQSSVKRMLAYSGIAHTGYLLLAFLIQPNDLGTQVIGDHMKAVVYYLLVYGVMTIGAFGVVSLVREDGKTLESFDNYAGLAKENPGIALCMSVFMFSLAGMPPFGGFFAKFMIFRGAVDQGHVLAAVLGILTSVASLYYYLRVVVAMYMPVTDHHTKESPSPVCRYSWGSSLLIYAAGIATLIIGVGLNLVSGWMS